MRMTLRSKDCHNPAIEMDAGLLQGDALNALRGEMGMSVMLLISSLVQNGAEELHPPTHLFSPCTRNRTQAGLVQMVAHSGGRGF